MVASSMTRISPALHTDHKCKNEYQSQYRDDREYSVAFKIDHIDYPLANILMIVCLLISFNKMARPNEIMLSQ